MARAARYYTEIMDDRAYDLQTVLDLLRDVGARYALIGGLAVGYHGHQRATVDVDMLVPSRFLKRIGKAARGRGFIVREFPPDMIRIYAPDSDEPFVDLVSADANPVLRAAFREVEPAEVLGQSVSVVGRGALIALKFHAAVSPTRAIEDKYQDVADIGHLIRGSTRGDEGVARRVAALAYPGAGDDLDAMIHDLRHGRPVRI